MKTYLDIRKQLKGNYILVKDDTPIDELYSLVCAKIDNYSGRSSSLSRTMLEIYLHDYDVIKNNL